MKQILKRILRLIVVLVGGFILYIAIMLSNYNAIDAKYDQLYASDPKNRDEVEALLPLFYSRKVNLHEAARAWSYGDMAGVKCTEYFMYFFVSIEVVYDENDRVVAILSSYE